jgi:uncharacterized protein YjiS (DUF1127 family)
MPYELIHREAPDMPGLRYSPSIVTVAIAAITKGSILVLRWAVAADLRLQRQRSRRFLGELTDYELRDIGLTRAQARHEAARRWWD